MNLVFANRSNDEEVFPLIIKEIAEEQHNNKSLHALLSDDNYEMLLIEKHKSTLQKWKIGNPKISTKRGSSMVPPLLPHPGILA